MAGAYRQSHSRFSSLRGGRDRQCLVRHGAILSGVVAAALLMAACGSSGGSPASQGGGQTGSSGNQAAAKTAVSARKLTGIGTVLVNSSGMTIYTPKTPAEVNGNIKCTGPCLSFWFPVTAGTASTAAISGLPGKFGTIHLSDGMTQLTYNGRPLYTFRLDTAAGQAHGNNYTDSFNGTTFTWQVVTASGKAGAAGPAPAASYSYPSGY